jgi:hypothetical protein
MIIFDLNMTTPLQENEYKSFQIMYTDKLFVNIVFVKPFR